MADCSPMHPGAGGGCASRAAIPCIQAAAVSGPRLQPAMQADIDEKRKQFHLALTEIAKSQQVAVGQDDPANHDGALSRAS